MDTNVTITFAIAAVMLVLTLLLGFLALGFGRFMGPRPRPAAFGAVAHNAAHNVFLTLPAYASTRELEAP